MGYLAVVEVGWVGGDAGEGAGELGLLERVACFIAVAAFGEDALGFGEVGEVGVGEEVGFLVG